MSGTIRAIRRALTSPSNHELVHFHLHHDGRAFVCDLSQCESPALTQDEVSARARTPNS
jgi:hypothetical protein